MEQPGISVVGGAGVIVIGTITILSLVKEGFLFRKFGICALTQMRKSFNIGTKKAASYRGSFFDLNLRVTVL